MSVQDSSSTNNDLNNWRRFRGRTGEESRITPVYKLKLNGPVPDKLAPYPQNLRTGIEARGRQMMQGVWRIGRDRIELEAGAAPWSRPGPSRHYADRLHRFEWLTDLCCVGPEGHKFGRALIEDWVEEFGRWNGFVWRIPVTADRVWNWLVGGPNLLENMPPDSEVMLSLSRQVRHLQHGAHECAEPRAEMRSLFAQLAYAFAADEGERRIGALEAQIEMLLGDHILADGGHVTRNPEALLDVLIDVQTIDDLYLRTGRPSLDFVTKLIPRMAGMLKFLRMQDGGLPVMNGGSEGRKADLKNALFPYSGTRAFAFATKSGVQKIQAEKTRLLLDAGHAPAPQYGHEAHAGCLAFELEDGAERIITNCGSHRDVDPVWQFATRRTDGHSTLALTGENCSHFVPVRALGVEAPTGPAGVSAKRMEESKRILIDAQHSGWKDTFGLAYRRRLFMDENGRRIVGEDSLFRPISAGVSETDAPVPFDVRFHLHPAVKLTPDGDHLRLLLPSGAIWIFKTKHKRKGIERSVYLGRGTVEKTWQLVLSGDADPNGDASTESNIVKWALVKLA